MNRYINILLIAVLLVLGAGAVADEFRLLTPVFRSPHFPTLYLSGASGSNYVIEASTDLIQWSPLFSGTAINNQLLFTDTSAENDSARFYRARLGVNKPFQVRPQPNINQVVSALISPDAGGSCSLTNQAGVRYTFEVGPSNVIDPVIVRMILVTNFTAFPDYEDLREAVQFEPEGYQFMGAGRLTIEFPTNVPYLKLSSFAYGTNGEQFHLVPDLVSTNKVTIPVVHFSGVGVSGWSSAERGQMYELYVEQVMDLLSSDVARALGQARQAALLGTEDPEAFQLPPYLSGRTQEIYDLTIKPYL